MLLLGVATAVCAGFGAGVPRAAAPPATVSIRTFGGTSISRPHGITAGPDGAIWFTQDRVGRIGRITQLGEVTEFSLPSQDCYPEAIVAGLDGDLWFTLFGSGRIGRITTKGEVDEFPLPRSSCAPADIVVDKDGALWFTEEETDTIGCLRLRTGL